jgi:hypothetical protein
MKDAYECHYGSKTSDGNGGSSALAGHYLRAQAHWELGHKGACPLEPNKECPASIHNPWVWEDKAWELHLFPSGLIRMAAGKPIGA